MPTSNVNHNDHTTVEEPRGNCHDEHHVDAVFDALSNARRRRVVRVLRQRGEPTPVSALAGSLATRDPGASTDRLAVSLTHVHLPKLESTGVVEFTDDGVVRYCDTPLAEALLEQL